MEWRVDSASRSSPWLLIAAALQACLLLVGSGSTALAHGDPPQVYGVAAVVEGRPRLVILNEGLALAGGDDSWSYLCPALWGDDDPIRGGRTKAQSLDGKTTWVIGDDVYAFDGRSFAPQGQRVLRELDTTVLAGNADSLFALHFGAAGHELVPVGTASYLPIWMPGSYWTTLAVDGPRLLVGRVVPEKMLDLTLLDTAGSEQARSQFALDAEASGLRLVPHLQDLFAIVDQDDRKRLGRLEAGAFSPLASAQHAILGPVASANGSLWIAIDGRLQPLPGVGQGALAPDVEVNCLDLANRPAAQCITCLGQVNGVSYACSAAELYRLGDDGLGERLFDLHGLRATPPELITDPVRALCDSQWAVFELDLRSNSLDPRGRDAPAIAGAGPANMQAAGSGGLASLPASDPAGTGGGCSALGGPAKAGHSLLMVLLLGAATWPRRRRSRQATPNTEPTTRPAG